MSAIKVLFFIFFFLPGVTWGDELDLDHGIQNETFNSHEELKKIGHENIGPKTFTDERAVLILKRMMENSPFQKASPREVRTLVLERVKGKPLEKFLVNNPKAMTTVVEILRDKTALSSLIGLFLRSKDLKKYGIIWLGLLIGGWLLKKIIVKKEWGFFKRLMTSLTFSVGLSVLSLGIFYHMFKDELSPIASIIARNYF